MVLPTHLDSSGQSQRRQADPAIPTSRPVEPPELHCLRDVSLFNHVQFIQIRQGAGDPPQAIPGPGAQAKVLDRTLQHGLCPRPHDCPRIELPRRQPPIQDAPLPVPLHPPGSQNALANDLR